MTALLKPQPEINSTNIAATFFAHAEQSPNKLAIHCEDTNISYQALANLVSRWSQAMLNQGVKRGDHIGVLLPNNIEFVALILVAANVGAALVPLNTSLTPDAISRAFIATSVKHIVSNRAILNHLLSSNADFSNITGLWLAIDDSEATQQSKVTKLDAFIEHVTPSKHALNIAHEDDALILTMTSGSTGDPKPIVLTQRTKFNRALSAQALYHITENDITLAATPLYHSLAERLVLIPLLTGGSSILMARYSAAEWLKYVETHQVSFTIAVSSQLRQIAERLNTETANTSSLRCLVSSSALLETEVKADLMTKLSCEFHECYGASEIAIASNLDGTAARSKLQSVGVAAPQVDIKILDKHDQIAAVGEAGEIVCKTPMLFGGYYQRPELTQAAMWGDYFRTGDIGKLDADGFLYYLGRKKDIIISGGINIYPIDIESVLTELESIKECAAFAYADQHLGEVVAVGVVPKDAANFNLKQAKFHCAERLADFQQPRKWFLLEDLPRNSMGKVMKFQLVEMYRNA